VLNLFFIFARMKQIFLKDKRDAAVLRFHPWVFSGAVARKSGQIEDGEWVEVRSHQSTLLGMGHYQDGSICVRLLSFVSINIDQEFWTKKIANAFHYRKAIELTDKDLTNCYRLVHGEGDGLPGLVIDVYGEVAVVQCHSIGMHRDRAFIAQALQEVYGDSLKAVFDKSAESLPKEYAAGMQNGYLFGTRGETTVKEHGAQFSIDWEAGQKTGFFLDQRENRRLLGEYAPGKRVLNAFCYTGGFSIYALKAGAIAVDSVDVSAKAMELTDRNVALNGFAEGQHQSYTADVLDFLRKNPTMYDLMIVDPPAFAKNLDKRHNAVQGYKRLNALAMEKINPGGILFTFSCSQVVNKQLFYDTIVAAALEAGRQVRVMHQLSQGPDHPVNMFHPEGDYLKGLVLFVE
jgi:23S rRNA (cytosine1962-C5)-methyltransferase